MRKAHEEVDEILGDQQIQLTDLGKLKYIDGTSYSLIQLFELLNDISFNSCDARDHASEPNCSHAACTSK